MSAVSEPQLVNPEREYVDDRDLERRTPICRDHWQRMRQRGEGPPWIKCGRRCLYRWADVVAWLEAQRVAPSGGQP
jgi:hypothetical protein